jgi:hypothetical protein
VDATKFTVNVQFAPTASVVEQVLVWVKLLALAPDREMVPTVSATPPLLVSVTVCATSVAPAAILGKVSEVVLRVAVAPGGVVIVPLNGIFATPPELALLAIARVAE